MRRERILLILGIWVAVLPYLGFPYFWKNILFSISGIILIYQSYIIHKATKEKEERESASKNLSEESRQNIFEHRYKEEIPEENININ